MQNVEGWPSSNIVQQPTANVNVNGQPREIESVSVRASVGSGDVASRTGKVVWAPSAPVRQAQSTVMSPHEPKRGDRVTVDVGDRGAFARMLYGRIDATSGDVPGALESELSDDWDLLSAEVDIPSLTATMYPDIDEGPLRQVGLTATWPTQFALSQAGFRATPDGWPGGAFVASLNGSLWPELGELAESFVKPKFWSVPWGDGARGYEARYHADSRTFSDGDLQISMVIADVPSTASSFVSGVWGGGLIQVVVDSTGAVRARISTGTPVSVVTLSAGQMQGAEHVVLRVTGAGSWTLAADNGEVATATRSIPAAFNGVLSYWLVNVSATSQIIGGLCCGFAESSELPVFRRSARLDSADGTLDASRAIISTPATDVIKERAAAEKAHIWISADGVFQWRARSMWGASTPVMEISDVDLLGYSLAMDYDSLYSGAEVSHLGPRVDVRSYSTITLYQGQSQTLSASDRETTIIEVPSDQDWPAVDWSMDTLNRTGNLPGFNRGRRSWDGAVRVAENVADKWAYGSGGNYASFDFETINARTWVHTTQIASSLPPGEAIETRVPNKDADDVIWPQWSEYALPVFRGYARVVWLDRKTRGTASNDAILPKLQHDSSWWVQGGAVNRLADWLADRHAEPIVTIKSLSIVPDQRIELGDVLTLTDKTYAGMSATVVVTGISVEVAEGSASMQLDVEILTVAITRQTYDDVQQTADDRTYAQFQALLGAVTYDEQEAL